MDSSGVEWYNPAMTQDQAKIPAWQLYGEQLPFPDLLHMERIRDRAAGLDWHISPHRHTHLCQIFLLLSGRISFALDGHRHGLAPPVMLFVPPGAVHGFAFSAGTEGWVLTLPVQHYPDLFGAGAELAASASRAAIATPPEGLTADVARLFDLWSGNGRFRRTELRCAIGQLLCALFSGSDGAGRLADPRIGRFLGLVATHFADRWPIARYAAELGMSVRNLGRLCRAETGLSTQALIEAHVMREASRLLAYTRMTAQAIGHQLGYDDPTYFNRRFRSHAGMSPGEYRRRLDT